MLATPFCATSIVTERRSLARSLPHGDSAVRRSAIRTANLVSYALMTVASLAYPLTT